MKRLLIASLLLNFVFVSALLYWLPKKLKSKRDLSLVKSVNNEIKSLPVDSNDIVFIGNSLTELFPINELFDLPLRNKGVGGNTSVDILNRIESIKKNEPRKIFLMVGINDINKRISIDSIMSNVNKIASGINPTTLYIQSVLPTSDRNKNKTIIKFNSLLKQYCLSNSITYIDLYTSFVSGEIIKPTYTADGVHLSLKGYEKWKTILLPFIY
jgi:lysophospholipase L1-like esterase